MPTSQNIYIVPSALRHGIERADAVYAWRRYFGQFVERDDPPKIIRIGFDAHGRILEVGGEQTDANDVKIFHAMPARKRYLDKIGHFAL